MEYRQLGRTGVEVSALSLGCMMFGGRTTADDAYRIIDRAIDAGINSLDTANVYNAGKSEEITGEALKRNGKRYGVVLATKVQGRMSPGPNGRGNSRRHIVQELERSLKRLKTDWVDILYLHRPERTTAIDETLRALDDLIRSGKVRYAGASNYGAWQIVESLWVAKELGLNRFVVDQSPYSLADRRVEREQIPMARTFGLAFIPWSPLGGGGLTGKYSSTSNMAKGTRFGDESDPGKLERISEGVVRIAKTLEPMAKSKGATVAQVALAWVMQQPGVTSPLVGPRTMEQLDDNLGALGVTFTDDDLSKIDAVIAPGEHAAEFHEASFAPNTYRALV